VSSSASAWLAATATLTDPSGWTSPTGAAVAVRGESGTEDSVSAAPASAACSPTSPRARADRPCSPRSRPAPSTSSRACATTLGSVSASSAGQARASGVRSRWRCQSAHASACEKSSSPTARPACSQPASRPSRIASRTASPSSAMPSGCRSAPAGASAPATPRSRPPPAR
jgi:hypothetical protein